MKIAIADAPPAASPDEIVAWIDPGEGTPLAAAATTDAHAGRADLKRREKIGSIDAPYLTASSPALLYLPGSAARHWTGAERIKILAAKALAEAKARRAKSVVFALDGPGGADAVAAVAEGLLLGDYDFSKYKRKDKEKDKGSHPTAVLVVPPAAKSSARAALKRTETVCAAVNMARDLVNEPGSAMTPEDIEAAAVEIAREGRLEIEILDAKRLKKEGYEGLLSVGRGGDVPPRMIVLRYAPKGARADLHLGLLGKGITFDTGGVSIKPAAKMWQMKGDMGGAAATLGAMRAVAALKPAVRVTAIVVTAQNYVDAKAIVPGDMIRARNGKFIHVDNTDAEGRLILTDGLWRAGEEKVTHLVDSATLTGSIVRAIGPALSGAFGNDDFADRVVEIAAECGEPCWRMPMVEEYVDLLKCEHADLNNIGGVEAGSITAALFLREFLPEGISWTHLDIAGPFLLEKPWKYFRPGATGVMVRTLAALAESAAEKGLPKSKGSA